MLEPCCHTQHLRSLRSQKTMSSRPTQFAFRTRVGTSKGFALTWYRALTWYSSPARPFAAPDAPLLVTGQQGSLSPACRQLSRAPSACAESSREESTKLGHGTKLGRTLATGLYLSSNACGMLTSRPSSQSYMLNMRREAYNTVFYSYLARFMNTETLNMNMFLSNTGFTRRKVLFIFLWLRPRNT